MTSKTSSSQRKPASVTTSRATTFRLESAALPALKKQKLKPLSALSGSAVLALNSSQASASQPSVKGKEKAISRHVEEYQQEKGEEAGLWIDMYEPKTEADLAVHARKVNDVRQWLLEALEGGPGGKLRKYRRILVLTGPAGTAKTSTMRVLSSEMGFEVLEWKNGMDERYQDGNIVDEEDRIEYESLSNKFHAFLSRAAICNPVLGPAVEAPTSSQRSRSLSSETSQQHITPSKSKRIILLEDLPNILHPPTQEAFHTSLQSLVNAGPTFCPVVIIISDAGVRGEVDQEGFGNSSAWSKGKGRGRDVVDIRTVLPSSLLHSPYVTHILFNPIAPTLMKRALQQMLTSHFTGRRGEQPAKDIVDIVIETSNGDIRSAIMALQFACVSEQRVTSNADDRTPRKGKSQKRPPVKNPKLLLEAMSRREQNLALFHLLGKILYNKRKGDAPSQSASAKDIQRDKQFDSTLKDPPALPPHLSDHARRASRVDVEALYADSPVDASLLSLYLHQNYTQYCDSVDECDGIMECMSWIDSNGAESWMQANPHQFHLVTLGTMHALPSPVARRGQKPYKPEFFESLKKSHDAEDGLRDVQDWLRHRALFGASWTQHEIAIELGGVLKAQELYGTAASKPPRSHRSFSKLEFIKGAMIRTDIVDDNAVDFDQPLDEDDAIRLTSREDNRGWLEDDDIEDFA